MSDPVVRLEEVTKRFGGRAAVEGLSFAIRPGEVFALLGPNGAGKTTTVRMLLGILRPDTGRIEGTLTPETTGYLPEDRGLYREIPVLRTLVYFGQLRGLSGSEARDRALAWLETMSLLDRKDDRLDALSKGNQQRVQLIASVLHRPAFAILDEPFTGLDPLSQEFFLELVGKLRSEGTTVLLSAHQMDLVERVADRVLLLNRGREILTGTLAELHGRLDARPRLRLTLDAGGAPDALRSDPEVEEISNEGDGYRITLRPGAGVPAFIARTVARVKVFGLTAETPRLHDLFLRAVREDDRRVEGRPR